MHWSSIFWIGWEGHFFHNSPQVCQGITYLSNNVWPGADVQMELMAETDKVKAVFTSLSKTWLKKINSLRPNFEADSNVPL